MPIIKDLIYYERRKAAIRRLARRNSALVAGLRAGKSFDELAQEHGL